jgi:hypothetical protein
MSHGDIATNSYNKYKEDVQLLKEIGVSMLFDRRIDVWGDTYEGVSKKFSDWPYGARTANATALCH